jgi:hypothetical protein
MYVASSIRSVRKVIQRLFVPGLANDSTMVVRGDIDDPIVPLDRRNK